MGGSYIVHVRRIRRNPFVYIGIASIAVNSFGVIRKLTEILNTVFKLYINLKIWANRINGILKLKILSPTK